MRLRRNFRSIQVIVLLSAFLLAAEAAVSADPACEKRILATGMIPFAGDEKIVCDDSPGAAQQECVVELLNKGKGKLRNADFFEVYGLCKVDSSRPVRDCVAKGLNKAWNDPSYQGVNLVGNKCLLELKGIRVKRYFSTKTEADAAAQLRWKKRRALSAKRAPVASPQKIMKPNPPRQNNTR